MASRLLLCTPPSGEAASLSDALGCSQASLVWLAHPWEEEIWIPQLASAGHVLTTFLALTRDHAPVWTQPLETSTVRPKCAARAHARSVSSCSLRETPRGDQSSEGLTHHVTEQNKGRQKGVRGTKRLSSGCLRASLPRATRSSL